MNVFLDQKQLEGLTMCVTSGAQRVWLNANDIPHYVNTKGEPVVSKEVLNIPRPSGSNVQPFPFKSSLFKSGLILDCYHAGIYMLLKKRWGGKLDIIYIGKTTNLFVRIAAHMASSKDFDQLVFIPMDAKMLDIAEREYIARYKPPLNTQLMPKCSAIDLSPMKKYQEVNEMDD